jgi:hypothetical protein
MKFMIYRYTLEKYKGGNSRHICPSCGSSGKFVRYVDVETGSYLADHVGRCNRQARCGYHYKPSQLFAEHPELQSPVRRPAPDVRIVRRTEESNDAENEIDFIPMEFLHETINSPRENAFLEFLRSHFSIEAVRLAIEKYFIGTWRDRRTVFWQIDTSNRARTGKLMAYNPQTGKRRKDRPPSWAHAQLKKSRQISERFNFKQCLFGEHLLSLASVETAVGIVESEKTAIIASIVRPEHIWVATGGCHNLRPGKYILTDILTLRWDLYFSEVRA